MFHFHVHLKNVKHNFLKNLILWNISEVKSNINDLCDYYNHGVLFIRNINKNLQVFIKLQWIQPK